MNKGNVTPTSIKLLFNNEKLEIMKVLCLLYALRQKRKKKIKIDEIIYYYSLVNFEFKSMKINSERKWVASNIKLLRFQTRINHILLLMKHMGFISINGYVSDRVGDIKVILKTDGKEFFEENESKFFEELKENYLLTIDEITYDSKRMKKMKEGSRWNV